MGRSKIDVLRSVPLFARLAKPDVEFLAGYVDEVDVRPGRVLIEQGSTNHAFWVIVEGAAEVTVNGKHRRDLGPGDFAGEISMLELTEATASVIAKTPIYALVVSHSQFRALEGNPNVVLAMREAMSSRLLADRAEPAPKKAAKKKD